MPVAVQKLDAPTVRKRSPDGYGPSFRCDECGGEIAKPGDGEVAWDPDENRTYLSAVFLHAGCSEAHRSPRERDFRTAGLGDFVASLERFAASA